MNQKQNCNESGNGYESENKSDPQNKAHLSQAIMKKVTRELRTNYNFMRQKIQI